MKVVGMPDDKSNYKRIAEAALFVSGHALSIDELSSIMGVSSIGYIKSVMSELIDEYRKNASALSVSMVGDSYIMGVKDQYIDKVNGLAGAPDISKGALRALAYISSNEPVMQSQVVKAFGTSIYDYVKELSEKGFISAVRLGRSKKLSTTKKFREYFNISKSELKDMIAKAAQ